MFYEIFKTYHIIKIIKTKSATKQSTGRFCVNNFFLCIFVFLMPVTRQERGQILPLYCFFANNGSAVEILKPLNLSNK